MLLSETLADSVLTFSENRMMTVLFSIQLLGGLALVIVPVACYVIDSYNNRVVYHGIGTAESVLKHNE